MRTAVFVDSVSVLHNFKKLLLRLEQCRVYEHQQKTISDEPGNSLYITHYYWSILISIDLTFQNESSINVLYKFSVCSCTDPSITKLLSIWPTTAHQFLTLFSTSACIWPAVIKSPSLATGSAHTAVGLFRLLIRLSGTKMSSVTVCNCPQNTPDPARLWVMSSRQSDWNSLPLLFSPY